jgi:hypothetical protein
MANYQLITPVQLAQAALTTSYAILYTTPASTLTYVKGIDVCNTTGGPISVYVSLVPADSVAASSNAIFYNAVVPGYTTLQWSSTQIMNAEGTLQAKASSAGATITASGGEAV